MPEQKSEKEKSRIAQQAFKWVLAALVVFLLAVIALIIWVFLSAEDGFWRPYDFERELAELEAARAIPDAENAATTYLQLAEEWQPDDTRPNFLDDRTQDATLEQPWSSNKYPELSKWLVQHKDRIDALLNASKKEKCRFSLNIGQEYYGYPEAITAIRALIQLLVRAGNNDFGDGRIDEALEKYICVICISQHLRQHPTRVSLMCGSAFEGFVSGPLCRFIISSKSRNEHLALVESALFLENDWQKYQPEIQRVEKLYEHQQKRKMGFLWWLQFKIYNYMLDDMLDDPLRYDYYVYMRSLALRRGMRILLALRRYKHQTGYWPENLGKIKQSAPAEAFVDPTNDGPFVYKLTEENFTLYSKGKNNIDEDGECRSNRPEEGEPDDWLIWPPRSRAQTSSEIQKGNDK